MEQRWGLPLVAWPLRLRPNIWDLVALPLVLGVLALVAWGGMAMSVRYQVGQPLPISLDPWALPEYALRTVLRMAWALVASLVFSLAYAALAAKSRQAEKILIPVLDMLQSVPILGFLSITVTGFIALFPGRLLGVECAAIFAIFTSQAWNMTFSLYQSLAHRAGRADRGRAHVPSVAVAAVLAARSAACGAVAGVEHDDVGVGRLVLRRRLGGDHRRRPHDPAARHRLLHRDRDRQGGLAAIGWAVLVMFVVILLYDQLLFRPLLAWSRKFQPETTPTRTMSGRGF